MPSKLTLEIKEVIGAIHYLPAVSVIMPFEPKMSLKKELMYSLKIATNKVEEEILKNYPAELGLLVVRKLKTIISNLNFNTHKKSIAIYVSPVFEKVLYLDIPVEEKIIVDESFEIRDLVFCKKQLHKYLVLQLSGKNSRIYVGNSQSFIRIVSDTNKAAFAYENDPPERVANFSDLNERKEVMMDKLLQHIDSTLDIILTSYNLPLFVIGTNRISGHFKKITKHSKDVVDYIPGNFDESSPEELRKILEPHVQDWKIVIQKNILNKLNDAANKKRLAMGMKEVWRNATNHKGQLLVVEKNYMYAAEHGGEEEIIEKATEPYDKFSYIKDAVDDVMEKVLEDGGDVEFVEEGLLKDYQHIALVLYYR